MRSRFILILILCFTLELIGCDAFVRKFTRKPKKDKEAEELVLAPEEYKAPLRSSEEIYRGYMLFWKSWHDELINSLDNSEGNHKKRVDCAKEALKNLKNMSMMLDAQTQKKLDKYVLQLQDLISALEKDIYGSNFSGYLRTAERIKLSVLKDFSYSNIKDNIK
jgi:hypothetical protein